MAKRTRAEKKANKPPSKSSSNSPSKRQLSTEALAQVKTMTNTVTPVSFSKQQRREVQQAIEKGMATIRTKANSKSRDQDKKIKQLQKQLAVKESTSSTTLEASNIKPKFGAALPWGLLILTWIGLGCAYLLEI